MILLDPTINWVFSQPTYFSQFPSFCWIFPLLMYFHISRPLGWLSSPTMDHLPVPSLRWLQCTYLCTLTCPILGWLLSWTFGLSFGSMLPPPIICPRSPTTSSMFPLPLHLLLRHYLVWMLPLSIHTHTHARKYKLWTPLFYILSLFKWYKLLTLHEVHSLFSENCHSTLFSESFENYRHFDTLTLQISASIIWPRKKDIFLSAIPIIGQFNIRRSILLSNKEASQVAQW